MEKHSFHKYFFYLILFFLGGGGGGGRVGKSQRLSPVVKGTVWQYYAPVINNLYPLPPPPTSIGGDNDFSKPCPVPVGTS